MYGLESWICTFVGSVSGLERQASSSEPSTRANLIN